MKRAYEVWIDCPDGDPFPKRVKADSAKAAWYLAQAKWFHWVRGLNEVRPIKAKLKTSNIAPFQSEGASYVPRRSTKRTERAAYEAARRSK